jgi:tetratricopeptide (TPR) repeat protein
MGMADSERDGESYRSGGDAFALGAATGDPALREDVRAYLRRQSELAAIQIEEARREDAVRHWGLRIRHISDVLKLGFELSLAFIVLAIAAGLGLAIWQAAHADGLVIDSFNVPGSMAQSGLSGSVVANKLLDRLTTMQNQTDSSRAPSSFANDWTNQITVQIPDTGVSLGQVVRFLDDWLGHQMHLSGDIYEDAGTIKLTVRIDDDPGQTFTGKPSDLDAIVSRAAVVIYARAQPYRYAVFLSGEGNLAASARVLQQLKSSPSRVDAQWAYLGDSVIQQWKGDIAAVREDLAQAQKINPNFANVFNVYGTLAGLLSHDEEVYRAETRGLQLMKGDGGREVDPRRLPAMLRSDQSDIAAAKGDFTAAMADKVVAPGGGGEQQRQADRAYLFVSLHDVSAARDALSKVRMTDLTNPTGESAAIARGYLDIETQDWRTAIASLDASIRLIQALQTANAGWVNGSLIVARAILPAKGYAYAMSGDFSSAEKILDPMPDDCDFCVRMHGKMEAARKNWATAERWFAMVSARSPDVPFADTDWGQMLLAKGDLDGAIAKFTSANKTSPHFADPLEMWGEALMLKNRSDLALAKFAEAAKYAPNWGRLRLKWGEALFYAGQKEDARKQFAIASHLDLSAADKTELTKWMVRLG